ncbi:hypothetical protein [Mycobacterium marinum]|uniref:hypothetical protein n=1 Tax=Mycobacterium marinum TaxID=1781 RepID=UPI00113FDE81|nr:hypothetical protein [Mycobacterium marinum]
MADRKSGVEISKDGLKALADHPAVLAERKKAARAIAKRANGTLVQRQSYVDYDVGVTEATGDTPARVTVYTRSNHAKHSNAKHNTLVKSL